MRKVFIGLSNTAGLSTRYKKAFTSIGKEADFYSVGNHPYSYTEDIKISFKGNKISRWIGRLVFICKLIYSYEYFVFITKSGVIGNSWDVKLLRIFRKKTAVVLVGCDVQRPELTHESRIPFSACHNCSEDYKRFVRCIPSEKPKYIKEIEDNFDLIISHYAYSDGLNRKYLHLRLPVDFEYINSFKSKKTERSGGLRIMHAPSNKGYKGTPHIIQAVNRLKNEGFAFSFELVEGVPITELYKKMSQMDIVIDQIIQGWYGYLPLESMALGVPVISYMRDDLLERLPSCPIINANPKTIYDVLKRLLSGEFDLEEIGKQSKRFVQEHHNLELVASEIIDSFESLKENKTTLLSH